MVAGEDVVQRLKSFTCIHIADKVSAFHNGCSSFARAEEDIDERVGDGSLSEASNRWEIVVVWDRELTAVSRQRDESHDLSLELKKKIVKKILQNRNYLNSRFL